MKTINQLQNDKRRLLEEISTNKDYTPAGRRRVKKAREEVKLITLCIRYLETTPSSDFITDSLGVYKTQIKKRQTHTRSGGQPMKWRHNSKNQRNAKPTTTR